MSHTSAELINYLGAVRALVVRGWTQHVVARNSAGDQCVSESSAAVCWCLLGAMELCRHPSTAIYQDSYERLRARARVLADNYVCLRCPAGTTPMVGPSSRCWT